MKLKLIAMSLLLTAVSVFASSVMVKDAYVRATPPGMPNSAAFMMVMNKGTSDLAVVSAKSDAAKKVEVHTHDMVNGMMKMYQVDKVDLKANSHTMFKPGGFHVMFLGLNKSLKEGDMVHFSLVLNNGEEIKVMAPVKKVMAGMKHGKMSGMKHGNMDHGEMKKMKKGEKCPCGMDAATCPMDHSKMEKMDHSKMKKDAKCDCGETCKCEASGKECKCGSKAMKHKM